MNRSTDGDALPDVRDGLTRIERIVLHELHRARRERGRAAVPTIMLYGRVLEHVDLSREEFIAVLQRLGAGPA